jgi:hypothetical protein
LPIKNPYLIGLHVATRMLTIKSGHHLVSWQYFTGRAAILDGTQQTLEQVKLEQRPPVDDIAQESNEESDRSQELMCLSTKLKPMPRATSSSTF